MPAVEIVPSPSVTRVRGSVTGPMPSFKAEPAAAEPAAPAAPAAPAKPVVPAKLAAAPAVPAPIEPSKPGEVHKTPAKDAAFSRLRDKANPKVEEPAQPTEPAKPAEPAEPTEPAEPAEPAEPTEPAATTTEEGKTAEGKVKVNPWKKVKEHEARIAELQQALDETKKLIPDEVGRKTEIERLTAAEKRAQELEQEIKYVNYSKSKEYQEKYWKPYEESYNRAMVELSELEVTEPSGEVRKVNPNDFNEILFAPSLIKAKAIATEKFGEFSEDVMGLRKDVRKLFEEQASALRRAKDEAGKRETEMAQQHETQTKQLQSTSRDLWEKANQSLLNDPEDGVFLKPVEGDEERNTVLQKGFELVDTGSRENPLDPSLTPEQRASIIKKHVAIRARAAAYPVIKHQLKTLQSKLAEVQAKLKEYEASTPTTEGGVKTASAPAYTRASERVYARLRSLAK